MTTDPVSLTADLIRCPSVTPQEAGALQILHALLEGAGFECLRVDRGGIANLFARWGEKGHPRTFGFSGHIDVVPIGDSAAWRCDPFAAELIDGIMFGRGAQDMKSGVAAFAAAAADFVTATPPDGAIVLIITGDEEGVAADGTTALLDWMEAVGEKMCVCLVGEPTCPKRMGEMMKIGRRGSMTAFFTVTGRQGHSAYPHQALNPLPALIRLLDGLVAHALDEGTEHFDPSTLTVTTIDTGNAANNVIPAQTRATVNLRFNDAHNSASLTEWLQAEADKVAAAFGVEIEMTIQIAGESFLTSPGELSDLVKTAVMAETGLRPQMSTSGGTSDARFIKDHCPVVEFGLVGNAMHQVDESVPVEQIVRLKAVYGTILRKYFA